MQPVEHLYFHIPFCPKICPYCCFFVEEGSKNKNRSFLDALLQELQLASNLRPILPKTIYFGGGTPTALLTDQLDYLLSGIRNILPLDNLREWTIEANPATIRPDKAALIASSGITRLSLGVQSWNPKTLKTLGRVHSRDQALRTVDILRSANIPSLNIDLMFSVPGQTPAEWRDDLQTTLALQPDHISAYCLTYELDTDYFEKLRSGEFQWSEEVDAELFETTMDTLENAGYRQYEISNYSRPGAQSLHNKAYWEGAPFLGFGPSAVSTIDEERIQNVADTALYSQKILSHQSAAGSREPLSHETQQRERIAFGLRMAEGVPSHWLEFRQESVDQFFELGLLESAGTRTRLTRKGRLLADSVAEAFV